MSEKVDELKDLENEFTRVHQQFVAILSAALIVLIVGAYIYRHLLHLTWVNAFYFCTVTLTTVGYGDITPNTNASKVFTIFYILIGIGIVATFATTLIKHTSLKREIRVARRQLKSKN
jgi:voltage-gated potassium channel Kch